MINKIKVQGEIVVNLDDYLSDDDTENYAYLGENLEWEFMQLAHKYIKYMNENPKSGMDEKLSKNFTIWRLNTIKK